MKNRIIILIMLTIFLGTFAACLFLLFGSSGCGSDNGFTTGERTIMSNNVERVYYLKLPETYTSDTLYPLVFAFHGLTRNYTDYSEGVYDLQEVVGDEAILVYPNALPNKDGLTQWNYERDLIFFDDLYRELESSLCFDVRKVFATGHSYGGSFTQILGYQRGNVLRAIAPVAGTFFGYENCTGQVAVMQIQGSNDAVIPIETTLFARKYWTAINSCREEETSEGVDPACTAYGGCDTNFPVQYCEHDEGHEWPEFASDAIWTFFKSLTPAVPSNETGSGDVEDSGVISFKIDYPADFVGTPDKLGLVLYPPDTIQNPFNIPSYILSTDIPPGEVEFGEILEYNDIEVNLFGVEYGDHSISVWVYVEGSDYPILTDGKDYQGLKKTITIDNSTIVIETPFELELL